MKTIITGGAGFIGSNAASRYLKRGHHVVVVDNLARDGVRKNLEWLRPQGSLEFHQLDIRDARRPRPRLPRASRRRPGAASGRAGGRHYFGARSARGFRDQCARYLQRPRSHAPGGHDGAHCIYSSTNKVYGEMTSVGVVERDGRYAYQVAAGRRFRGAQSRLSFALRLLQRLRRPVRHRLSPHLRPAHHRLPAVLHLRLSPVRRRGPGLGGLVYDRQPVGPSHHHLWRRQTGARHSLHRRSAGRLRRRVRRAATKLPGAPTTSAAAPSNVLSLRELLAYIEKRSGAKIPAGSADWRPGDQKVFVSDIRRAQRRARLESQDHLPAGPGSALRLDRARTASCFLKLSPTLV